jgi:hypothetical protein
MIDPNMQINNWYNKKNEKSVDIVCPYEMNESMIRIVIWDKIRTVIRDKDQVMPHVKSSVPMQSTIISKKKSRLTAEIEKWLNA